MPGAPEFIYFPDVGHSVSDALQKTLDWFHPFQNPTIFRLIHWAYTGSTPVTRTTTGTRTTTTSLWAKRTAPQRERTRMIRMTRTTRATLTRTATTGSPRCSYLSLYEGASPAFYTLFFLS